MKKKVFCLAVALLLAACGGEREAAPPEPLQPGWGEFVAGVVGEYYERRPESAVYAGLHEYDGRMSDYSLAGLESYAAWLDATIEAALGYADLEGIDAFERDYLVTSLRGNLFWLRDARYPLINPDFYSIDVAVYVDREYAPPEERIAAYTEYVSRVPALLATMRANLEPPLPAPLLEISHAVFEGLAGYLETTVPELFAGVADERLRREFAAANAAAVAAVRDSAAWLDGLKATASDDFALGEELFLKMLRDTEGVDISLAALKAAGELDLQRNLEALEAACAEFAPGASTKDCVLAVQQRKPPEGAVAGAVRQLPGLKQFLLDNDIVSIPGDEEALVAESPPHRRFNTAYINIPGPFESGLPSVYYIAPPDPAWSEQDQRAYVPGEMDLLAISVHEVWPGHFLQDLHANRVPNRVGRHFGTYSFGEGWAHYAEQMMWDAGLGEGDREVQIGMLLNLLKRNVRYLSAIGLHTGGMTVEQSQAMFAEKAFLDFGNASQQALRGTYDPGYLNYTLGKLMIEKLRDDWTAGRGGREAWGRFHDEFLGFGSPPVPLLREHMLGPDYGGDAALLPH